MTLGIFGTIENPLGSAFPEASAYSSVTAGLPLFISNIVRLITIVSGLWVFANIVLAGFLFITASGEAEKVARAWNIIWQSLVGLVVVVAAFIITGILSMILFGDASVILKLTIYGPGSAN